MEAEISVDHLFFLWLLYYCVENNQDPGYMNEKNPRAHNELLCDGF